MVPRSVVETIAVARSTRVLPVQSRVSSSADGTKKGSAAVQYIQRVSVETSNNQFQHSCGIILNTVSSVILDAFQLLLSAIELQYGCSISSGRASSIADATFEREL